VYDWRRHKRNSKAGDQPGGFEIINLIKERYFMLRFLFAAALFSAMLACGSSQQEKKFATEPSSDAESVSGEVLFKRNCSQCHLPNKDFIGPALAGVESRWKSKDLLYKFIRNSQEVIQTDPYAKELFIKWKELPMLPNPNLTDAAIYAILTFINEGSATR
jgi:cytochrome c551/c552